MPWNSSLVDSHPIVETCFMGEVSLKEPEDAVSKTLALAHESDRHLLLADCARMTGGHSSLDLYSLADLLRANSRKVPLREAIILSDSPAMLEMIRFWRSICANRGLAVQLFNDRKSAVEWLIGSSRTGVSMTPQIEKSRYVDLPLSGSKEGQSVPAPTDSTAAGGRKIQPGGVG